MKPIPSVFYNGGFCKTNSVTTRAELAPVVGTVPWSGIPIRLHFKKIQCGGFPGKVSKNKYKEDILITDVN